jgi:predicted ATP-dependent endonuclease of OLD family
MIKESFDEEKRDINLFFIEEPEAHTHQQMQYVFIKQIKKILKGIDNLQTVISTHSAHIVSQCDFEDIRYFFNHDGKVRIKNFYEELKEKYSQEKEDYFKFLTQYLTLNTSELFFASKIIFIEGTSERFLLPYFIKQYDKKNSENEILSNQNISILEVGANGRAFKHFLQFLEIKTLIITDIDTTKKGKNQNNKTVYSSEKVENSSHTSNYTLTYYLDAPEIKDEKLFSKWMKNLKNNNLQNNTKYIKIAYQIEENQYHARSFEDAFISINLENIQNSIDDILGLKNKKQITGFSDTDFYTLTKSILDKKSDFASSILYLGLKEDDIEWKIPLYIEEGLKWIAEK